MRTQAWGWLAAAVLAAGLNANYHDGGLQWAHEIVGRIGHSTNAVVALATGHADQFLTEARLITEHRRVPSCPLTTALAEVRTAMPRDFDLDQMEVISAREQAQLARIEARRARIEAQVARIRIPALVLDRIAIPTPQVSVCPRIRVDIPRMPRINVPNPRAVSVETFNFGPV
jgi:hypothetical protein